MNEQHRPTLIVITGPTGSGKSDLAVRIAENLGCEIISADSRQIYKDIPIGTAAPDAEQKAAVPHHFVGILDLDEPYSAARFESDVLALLPQLWKSSPYAIMCGGSMMYIDAVVNGIDDLPEISPENRRAATDLYLTGGIEAIRSRLRLLDPAYYDCVDINNHKRIIHAIEISLQAGVPYSSLRTGVKRKRDFDIIKFALDYPRDRLFCRINRRVEAMIAAGWEKEAEKDKENNTEDTARQQDTEYQEPHPESVVSLCYSCKNYSSCDVKTATCAKCDRYINKAESEKTEEQKYSEEQDKMDRETAKRLREQEYEEKMKCLPSEAGNAKKYIRVPEETFLRIEEGKQSYLILKNDDYKAGQEITVGEFAKGRATGKTLEMIIKHMDDEDTSSALETGYCVIGIAAEQKVENIG